MTSSLLLPLLELRWGFQTFSITSCTVQLSSDNTCPAHWNTSGGIREASPFFPAILSCTYVFSTGSSMLAGTRMYGFGSGGSSTSRCELLLLPCGNSSGCIIISTAVRSTGCPAAAEPPAAAAEALGRPAPAQCHTTAVSERGSKRAFEADAGYTWHVGHCMSYKLKAHSTRTQESRWKSSIQTAWMSALLTSCPLYSISHSHRRCLRQRSLTPYTNHLQANKGHLHKLSLCDTIPWQATSPGPPDSCPLLGTRAANPIFPGRLLTMALACRVASSRSSLRASRAASSLGRGNTWVWGWHKDLSVLHTSAKQTVHRVDTAWAASIYKQGPQHAAHTTTVVSLHHVCSSPHTPSQAQAPPCQQLLPRSTAHVQTAQHLVCQQLPCNPPIYPHSQTLHMPTAAALFSLRTHPCAQTTMYAVYQQLLPSPLSQQARSMSAAAPPTHPSLGVTHTVQQSLYQQLLTLRTKLSSMKSYLSLWCSQGLGPNRILHTGQKLALPPTKMQRSIQS